MTRSPDFCSVFRSEASKVWTDMSDAWHFNLPRNETTTTEELLLRLARNHKKAGLHVEADTNERNTGGDWLFWFGSKGKGGLPVRLQAKRLYASGRYEQLDHPYKSHSKQGYTWKNQCEALLGYAKTDGAIPLYVFYNSVQLFARFSAHQRIAWWKDFDLASKSWGISTTSPLAVKNADWGKRDKVGDFPMVPWHCLVCSSCWKSRPTDYSLPFRVGHYLRQLYRYSGGAEGAPANISDLGFSFEPTLDVPEWVGLLKEGNARREDLVEEMDRLNLGGVALIEEVEAVR